MRHFYRFLTTCTVLAAAAVAQTGIEGTWQGTIDAGAVKLRLGLHISRSDAGELVSKLDSIEEGRLGLPVPKTTFVGPTLRFELPAARVSYEGHMNAAGDSIAGTFTQQGVAVPLTFKRVKEIETLRRPQLPQPPFPYDSENVLYENKAGGVKLAGTLTLPRGGGAYPAALLITGSGPQDRDDTMLGHKPFLVIADYLSRHGIAVLRVDDRGMGKSTGNSTRSTLDDFAGDVLAGVEFLKQHPGIQPHEIGVIGHSEGGVVGPYAAARSADIAFVVMLAGTGVTGEQVLYDQATAIARKAGASDAAIRQNRVVQEALIHAMMTESDEKAAAARMRSEWNRINATMPAAYREAMGDSDAMINLQIGQFNNPEFRSFVPFDPATVLRKVRVPVLALNGSRDVQVTPELNLPAIATALAQGGNTDFTVAELPGLNHLFQACRQCVPAEYGTLEETFSPAALEIMTDWIVRHTKAR